MTPRFPLRRALAVLFGLSIVSGPIRADEPVFSNVSIFEPEQKHNHSSCVTELPDGDLFVAWYRGSGERSADDVQIFGSRLSKGATQWSERFLIADTPDYPDCNPAIFSAPDRTFWLWRPVIIDHHWESAILKFSKAAQAPEPGKPVKWDQEGVLHVTPVGFEKAVDEAFAALPPGTSPLAEAYLERTRKLSKDLLYQRLGWMPRVRPLALPTGRWLLPLYCDTFSFSLAMYSDDKGATWKPSNPIIGWGAIQPAFVLKNDGTLVAYMRDNGPFRRVRMSTSKDDGATWGPVTSTELLNPGSGVDCIRLASGKWAMIYNDLAAKRYSLALSLSDDEGATWKWTRHVGLDPKQVESYHYPSILQTADGMIHVTYSHHGLPGGKTIDHARFNEAWVQAGDPK